MGQVSDPHGSGGGDPDASYLLAALSASLPNDRVLTPGTNISFVDGGPGAAFTINSTAGGAPINASYVCIGLDATLTNERVLAVGGGLQLIDGGANANVTISVANNAITDAMLRQGAATSLIGRAANSIGNVADIAAVADGDVMRRAAGVLGFGAIPEASVTNLVADLAAKVPTTRLINTTAPIGGGGDLSADRTLSINANGITDAFLRQGAATSLIGRSANSIGNVADIAAVADGDVMRRAGGALGFGAIPESSVTNLIADLAAKQAGIQFEDEGVNLGASGTATELDFTGAGVTTSRALNKVTVNIPGGAASPTSVYPKVFAMMGA